MRVGIGKTGTKWGEYADGLVQPHSTFVFITLGGRSQSGQKVGPGILGPDSAGDISSMIYNYNIHMFKISKYFGFYSSPAVPSTISLIKSFLSFTHKTKGRLVFVLILKVFQ